MKTAQKEMRERTARRSNVTAAAIGGLTTGTTYYFVVTAYQGNGATGGESANSSQVSAVPT